ncbi:MAG: TatD family deoxyribonuclease, partial [Nitrospirae bacterium]
MSAFDEDREDAIQRAREAGLEAMITVGSDLKGNTGSLELSRKYDFIYSSVGIHPHDAKDFTEEIYEQLKKWGSEFGTKSLNPLLGGQAQSAIRNPKVVAIGETGLDYHYDNSPREVQKEVFRKHLELAGELDLPVIIHSREAQEDTLDILKESGISNGVLHCFS